MLAEFVMLVDSAEPEVLAAFALMASWRAAEPELGCGRPSPPITVLVAPQRGARPPELA
ncbi:hypothetical protein OG365_39795 (plasmid) [Streptomyces sp. NBC_00853]|uniref:hypothetical protein n=1 Tax=Streptomyces sp. NBC_00853 TaxID=2903681 RepID=UPI0038736B02|nr:hypothetical protein OG365_39795 [Streptomyces sp. NBC_00853]